MVGFYSDSQLVLSLCNDLDVIPHSLQQNLGIMLLLCFGSFADQWGSFRFSFFTHSFLSFFCKSETTLFIKKSVDNWISKEYAKGPAAYFIEMERIFWKPATAGGEIRTVLTLFRHQRSRSSLAALTSSSL